MSSINAAGRGTTNVSDNSFTSPTRGGGRADKRTDKVADFLRAEGINVDAMPARVLAQLSRLSEKDLTKLVEINQQFAERAGEPSDDVNGYVVF